MSAAPIENPKSKIENPPDGWPEACLLTRRRYDHACAYCGTKHRQVWFLDAAGNRIGISDNALRKAGHLTGYPAMLLLPGGTYWLTVHQTRIHVIPLDGDRSNQAEENLITICGYCEREGRHVK